MREMQRSWSEKSRQEKRLDLFRQALSELRLYSFHFPGSKLGQRQLKRRLARAAAKQAFQRGLEQMPPIIVRTADV